MNAAIELSKLLPSPSGALEWIFLLLLVSLLGIVGIFAGFVVAQQFRNPGRSNRRH